MASYIPFVNTKGKTDLFKQYYRDAPIVRVSIEYISKTNNKNIWIDPGMDGFGNPDTFWSDDWKNRIEQYRNSELFNDSGFANRPSDYQEEINAFVSDMLEDCNRYSPGWISVPQLPVDKNDASKKKINRILAKATISWKAKNKYRGKFMLPVILSSQNQYLTGKNELLSPIKSCQKLSEADGIWVVDRSLDDQQGSGPFPLKRFPSLIDFHIKLRAQFSKPIIITAGPYWCLNLVLWTRNIIDYPSIGVGSGFQYHLSGGKPRSPLNKLALTPLRRLAVNSIELRNWLEQSLRKIPKNDSAYYEFESIYTILKDLTSMSPSRKQISEFYLKWLKDLENASPSSRPLLLYQQLSHAFVIGKGLGPLKSKGTDRHPYIVAEQHMLNCL